MPHKIIDKKNIDVQNIDPKKSDLWLIKYVILTIPENSSKHFSNRFLENSSTILGFANKDHIIYES